MVAASPSLLAPVIVAVRMGLGWVAGVVTCVSLTSFGLGSWAIRTGLIVVLTPEDNDDEG